MSAASTLQAISALSSSFIIGSTAWFFFLQSPVLLSVLGREKFVPVQMRLTRTLFRSLTVAASAALAATVGAEWGDLGKAQLAAAVALTATLINTLAVVPRALQAGKASMGERKGKDSEGSTAKFASEGGSRSTAALHRTVVVFVVLMLAGSASHLALELR
eukprot:TRINITY_DN16503_c0_g1_i1.p2 TRINITY_DN16503_c0_g1~~TRINITY_DN16503_c0_g1_i1.p2  ORF type:complete len:161 (+),score=63.24 TRINITY_DN16503_c0_g1_i1:84-566(+)